MDAALWSLWERVAMVFSDGIVYVDETADHGLENINHDDPVFALAYCIFEKDVYVVTSETPNPCT